MSSRNLNDLFDELAQVVRGHQFGLIQLAGDLTGWRTHRSGLATAELTAGQPPEARLRVVANRHAALAVLGELNDSGRTSSAPGSVTVHGHLTISPRWGIQFELLRLRCTDDAQAAAISVNRTNHAQAWPAQVSTIGVVDPDGGDDARDDVIASLAHTSLTIVEHRVPVTGGRAPLAISHALDRLALDPRPDVTVLVRGGGPDSDFVAFDSPLVLAAIARHPRPVVTGLGHAGNHTGADEAAHTACITPTAAAQTILNVLLEAVRVGDPRRSSQNM